MNEAMDNVFVSENDEMLRGRCAPAHLPCCDSGVDDVTPVPTLVPGDFTVRLGDVMPGWVMEGLEAEFGKYGGVTEAVSGFLSCMQWVEVEVRGYDDLLEGLSRLKGALMAVGAAVNGE